LYTIFEDVVKHILFATRAKLSSSLPSVKSILHNRLGWIRLGRARLHSAALKLPSQQIEGGPPEENLA